MTVPTIASLQEQLRQLAAENKELKESLNQHTKLNMELLVKLQKESSGKSLVHRTLESLSVEELAEKVMKKTEEIRVLKSQTTMETWGKVEAANERMILINQVLDIIQESISCRDHISSAVDRIRELAKETQQTEKESIEEGKAFARELTKFLKQQQSPEK